MGIKQLTPMQSVTNYMDEHIARKRLALINLLSYVGESCVREMRDNYDYEDQTGNLTSSKGYVLIEDGRVLNQAIEMSKKGTDRATGVSEGKEFMNTLINRFPQGIVLILVVGMNYSAYVSAKGYNVADSAETLANRLVTQMLKQIGFVKR